MRAILPDNCGGWYVGGNFTHDTTHVNLLHIKKDKQVDAAWNPSTNGTGVRAMVLDQPNMAEPGRLYIGGSFTTVNNTVPRNNVAAITTPSFTNCLPDAGAGGVDPNWNPKADGAVFALAPGKQQLVPGSPPAPLETIYVGGAFTNFTDAGGTIRARSKVAALNLTDGTPTTWNPSAQPATSNVFALAVTATNVYVGGGGFTSIGGQSRTNLAEIDRSTATATSWAPNPNSRVDSLLMPQPFDPPPAWVSQGGDGPLARMYVGGQFTTIGSPPVARSKAAELNLADNGSATTWDPSLTGAAGQAFFPIADTEVIVGGAFHLVQGNLRSRLAETYAKTGVPYDWHPNMDKAVYALAHVSPVLAVGGLFTTVGPPIPPHPRLAFFCPVTGPQACSVP